MQATTVSTKVTAVRRVLAAALTLSVAALLSACGGDSECPAQPPFGGSGQGGTCGNANAGAPVAADLALLLSANQLNNDGTSTLTATATAVDANRNAVAGIPVTISVNSNAVAVPSGSKTDDTGKVTAAVGSGADRANRTVTVTAVTGGLVRTATFQVVGSVLTGTPLPTVVAPGAAGQVVFQLKDANSIAMANQAIVVNGIDGVDRRGSTDNNGQYIYSYTAPALAGTVMVRATAGGVSNVQSILVQASGGGAIPPAALAVQSASLAASPSVVQVNSAATTNQAELRALFLGAGNAPVKNVRVRFDLAGDLNNIGGSISSGTNVVYSNDNGIATAAYVPGGRESPLNGLTVRACWSLTDFPEGSCPNATQTTLTVVALPLSVSIGTDALIEVSGRQYVKRYDVKVVDSSGAGKAGVVISPSIDLLQYHKGVWVPFGDEWAQTVRASCDNEDLNRNGVAEVYSNGAVEDANNSASLPGRNALEPRKADVAFSFEGSNATNGDGIVTLKVTYLQNVASWVGFNLQVSASGISGTEGRAGYTGVLPVPADAVSDKSKPPPFVASPYGTQTSPTVVTTTPDGQTGLLCTNPN